MFHLLVSILIYIVCLIMMTSTSNINPKREMIVEGVADLWAIVSLYRILELNMFNSKVLVIVLFVIHSIALLFFSFLALCALCKLSKEKKKTDDQGDTKGLKSEKANEGFYSRYSPSKEMVNGNNTSDRFLLAINVAKYPKLEYEIGELFDEDGLQLTAIYNDGTRELIDSYDSDFSISGFDSDMVGTQNVIVSYQGYTTAIPVVIKEQGKIRVDDVVTPVGHISVKQNAEENYDVTVHSELTGKNHKFAFKNGKVSFIY